jgi:hypothetical protein
MATASVSLSSVEFVLKLKKNIQDLSEDPH